MQCPILLPSFTKKWNENNNAVPNFVISFSLCVCFSMFIFVLISLSSYCWSVSAEKQSQKNKINPKTLFQISLHFHGTPHAFSTPKHALQKALHQPQQNCLRRRICCPSSFWSSPNIVSSSGRLRRDIRCVSRATWSFLLDSSA